MITQPPPTLLPEPQPEAKRDLPPGKRPIRATPLKKRMGETPAALFTKSILRVPIKGLYYLITGIRKHKLLSFIALVMLIASISLTTFFTTGAWPLGIGSDPFQFRTQNGQAMDKAGDHVRNWVYALREGNVTMLSLLNSELIQSQPPDPQQLVNSFSKAHVGWGDISVSTLTESDSTVDCLVSIAISTSGPGGKVNGTLLIHFTTYPPANGRLLFVDVFGIRPTLS